MSRFTVIWRNEALDELAEVWLAAADRAAVTAAVDLIESQLSVAPHRCGVPLAEGLFKVVQRPVKVYFEVRDVDWVVAIGGIQLVGDASDESSPSP